MSVRVPLLALTALGLAVACGPAAIEPSASGDEARGDEALSDEPAAIDYAGAPEGSAAITSLLGARHTRDLPDEETLRAHPEPAAALRWIAVSHPRMVIRGRALSRLQFFDDAETSALLEATLRDVEAHPTLRASAAAGTARLALDEPLRDALAIARASGDPRVTRAVDRRLELEPSEATEGSPLAD